MKKLLNIKQVYTLFFVLFFVLLTLGQLQRIQITNSVAFYLHEVVLFLWFSFTTFMYKSDISFSHLFSLVRSHPNTKKKSKILTLNLNFWNYGIFLIVAVIYTVSRTGILTCMTQNVIPLLYLARIFLYTTFGITLFLGIKNKLITKQKIIHSCILVGMGIASLGLLQYFFLPDTRFLFNYGWDEHYYRLISTLFDPGFTALILVFSFLLFFINILEKKRKKIYFSLPFQFVYLSLTLLFLTTILLTYSRAGYLSFIMGFLTLAWHYKSFIPIMLIVLFVSCIPFLPRPESEGTRLERTASIHSRIESNNEALSSMNYIEVLFGKGLYSRAGKQETEFPSHAIAPDNSFIFIFTSTGILGSFLFLFVCFFFLQEYRTTPFISVFLALGVHALFNNSLFYIWVWVFVSGVVVLMDKRI